MQMINWIGKNRQVRFLYCNVLLLKCNITKMSDKADIIKQFERLRLEHDELLEKYNTLQNEYSENTIIQSMHDMKERYEILLETTVSIYKYELLERKCDRLTNYGIATKVLVDHLLKLAKKLEEKLVASERSDLYKIEVHLMAISDMLEDLHCREDN